MIPKVYVKLVSIVFCLDNLTFFWSNMTFGSLKVPRGGVPVQEIFLKNTMFFTPSLMANGEWQYIPFALVLFDTQVSNSRNVSHR